MQAHHDDELWIALGRPDGGGVADSRDQRAGNPEPEAQRDRRRQRAVGDRDSARRPAHEDGVGERTVDRREEVGRLHGSRRPGRVRALLHQGHARRAAPESAVSAARLPPVLFGSSAFDCDRRRDHFRAQQAQKGRWPQRSILSLPFRG